MTPTLVHPAYVYAVETESAGVHNCPRCNGMVVWGVTTKGNRARFDYPAGRDGNYVNHHVTCAMEPAKKRVGRLADRRYLGTCRPCHEALRRGNALCRLHWREFRACMTPDAYAIWIQGDRRDRRMLLRHWQRHERRAVA